jgi:hypothetical protein
MAVSPDDSGDIYGIPITDNYYQPGREIAIPITDNYRLPL